MSEALYIIGAVVVLTLSGTLTAVWFLMYANEKYRPGPLPAVVKPRQATISWLRRNSTTEFRLAVGGPQKAEIIVVNLSDGHLLDLAAYIRDLEQHGNTPSAPTSPCGSARRPKFSLIDGRKEEA